ncbi:MAG: RDD family protein [Candidatus Taylorbacteria bacterium]
MENVPPAVSGQEVVPVKYAGFWIRYIAVFVDSWILVIPIGILQFVLSLALKSIGVPVSAVSIITGLFYMVAVWAYYIVMTHQYGATLGKMLVGIRVKSDDLSVLPLKNIIIRETVGKFVSGILLSIGYIIAAFTDKKRSLHDMFAHSVVVYKDPSKKLGAGVIIAIIVAAILPIIAIFGILSSVVLVSLNVARGKATDARVTSNLMSVRTIAEVYSMKNNSYSTARDCTSGMFADDSMKMIISTMSSAGNNTLTCLAHTATYAISSTLKDPTKSFCIDSTGYMNSGVAIDDGSKAFCKK